MNGDKTPFIVLVIILIITALITDSLNWPSWTMFVMTGIIMVAYLFWSSRK